MESSDETLDPYRAGLDLVRWMVALPEATTLPTRSHRQALMAANESDEESAVRQATPCATTQWSVVLAAGDTASPESQEALEKLCRQYWFPLYAFVRRKGYSPEDAQDLTQEFFRQLLEKPRLRLARIRCGADFALSCWLPWVIS